MRPVPAFPKVLLPQLAPGLPQQELNRPQSGSKYLRVSPVCQALLQMLAIRWQTGVPALVELGGQHWPWEGGTHKDPT